MDTTVSLKLGSWRGKNNPKLGKDAKNKRFKLKRKREFQSAFSFMCHSLFPLKHRLMASGKLKLASCYSVKGKRK